MHQSNQCSQEVVTFRQLFKTKSSDNLYTYSRAYKVAPKNNLVKKRQALPVAVAFYTSRVIYFTAVLPIIKGYFSGASLLVSFKIVSLK